MQVTDEAIILSSSKYGESSGIVSLFTAKHGIYKGLVRGISGKQNRAVYQSGNIVEATWRARLPEHLGSISAGLLLSGATSVMDNPAKLAALSSLCAIIEVAMQERDPAETVYKLLHKFIANLGNAEFNWQQAYIHLEIELLSQLGYGIDITECADTGVRENLVYVSPRTGRAVCESSGRPYHDKLLKLPGFLLAEGAGSDASQISDGVRLTSYFFDKYFFTPNNIIQPQARIRMINMLKKN